MKKCDEHSSVSLVQPNVNLCLSWCRRKQNSEFWWLKNECFGDRVVSKITTLPLSRFCFLQISMPTLQVSNVLWDLRNIFKKFPIILLSDRTHSWPQQQVTDLIQSQFPPRFLCFTPEVDDWGFRGIRSLWMMGACQVLILMASVNSVIRLLYSAC